MVFHCDVALKYTEQIRQIFWLSRYPGGAQCWVCTCSGSCSVM